MGGPILCPWVMTLLNCLSEQEDFVAAGTDIEGAGIGARVIMVDLCAYKNEAKGDPWTPRLRGFGEFYVRKDGSTFAVEEPRTEDDEYGRYHQLVGIVFGSSSERVLSDKEMAEHLFMHIVNEILLLRGFKEGTAATVN